MAKIIRQKKGNFNHYKTNHLRCFCHVIALILGAGLKSLKLKKNVRVPARKPEYFPTLETIVEFEDAIEIEDNSDADNSITELSETEDIEEIDADDASEAEGSEIDVNDDNGNKSTSLSRGSMNGIGNTLMKVCHK
ncbi:hypothetical protein PCANC_19483 [Puccinia coronata f. sp. avenae]|uniref:hAT-like transposase RNase-H fold domain-containing protein n=1 Tax=Puccinia coronata f. sp. avenae TaxID=200324 RepID=A0A2N5U919_9BASI|nr:hypothetical protein PCANC_19483 [Puccinia coronata f. sp. avenae]